MKKLFVSYAHLDSGIVLNVSQQLQEEGYQIWIDKFGIQGGELWVSEIVKGIRGCDIFLLFVSSNSTRSEYVRRELDVAFHEKRKIIHVMIEKTEIPDSWIFQLAGLQYVDYQSPDWKTQLLDALRGDQPYPSEPKPVETEPSKNPYSSLPVLELVERSLVFSNRGKELQEGIEQIRKHRLLIVTGMPGIGKSTFARALLDSRPADAPEPFWYNFEHQQNTGNTLDVLLDRLSGHLEVCFGREVRREVMAFRDSAGGMASSNDVDVLIRFLNRDKPIWLVFDNLETVLSRETGKFLDKGLEALFNGLKIGDHSAKIIVTNPFIPVMQNGEQYLEDGTEALALEGFEDDAEIEFLQAYGLQELPKNVLLSIVRETNGHPFILNHIARYIRAVGITATMKNLQASLQEISEQFGASLKRRLSKREFNALQSLTVLNREISFDGLCQVARVRPGIIVNLREIGLLQTDEADNFWMHNIVRNSLKPVEPRTIKQAHLRAMNYYCSLKVNLLPQSIDDCANLLEWHHHAVGASDSASAYKALYSTSLESQLLKWNAYDLLAQLCEQTLAIAGTENNKLSNVERVHIHRTLGTVYFYVGDISNSIAYLRSAVDLLQSDEAQELRIALMIELSESYNSNHDFGPAMEICNKAIRLLSVWPNENLQAKVIHLKGIINRDRGEAGEAISDLESAIKLYDDLNDLTHLGNATIDLGNVYFFQNQFTKAVANYERALNFFESVGDIRGIIIARFNIADFMLQNEQYQPAVNKIQPAVDIARQKKFTTLELRAGLILIEAQIALLNLDEAERELARLSPLIIKWASPCISGQELVLLAYKHAKLSQPEQAMTCFNHAFELLENPDCQYEYAHGTLLFAGFLKEQGELEKARDILSRASNVFAQMNSQLGLQAVQKMLAGSLDK